MDLLSMSIKWNWTHCQNHFVLIPVPPQSICVFAMNHLAFRANMRRNNQIISSHIFYTPFLVYVSSQFHCVMLFILFGSIESKAFIANTMYVSAFLVAVVVTLPIVFAVYEALITDRCSQWNIQFRSIEGGNLVRAISKKIFLVNWFMVS